MTDSRQVIEGCVTVASFFPSFLSISMRWHSEGLSSMLFELACQEIVSSQQGRQRIADPRGAATLPFETPPFGASVGSPFFCKRSYSGHIRSPHVCRWS